MARSKPLTPHHLSHLKVLRGDEVLIITGKDKGQKGRVEKTFPRSNRVIVEGHNLVKSHMKARPGAPASIVSKSMPLHISNVMVVCTECHKPTRVGYERVLQGDGANQRLRVRRICKECSQPIVDQTRMVRS